MRFTGRSLNYGPYNDRKTMAAGPRAIYTACDGDAAYAALAESSGTEVLGGGGGRATDLSHSLELGPVPMSQQSC